MMINSPRFATADLDDLPEIVRLKLAMFDECGHAAMLATDAFERILEDYISLYGKNEARHYIARSGARIVSVAGAFIKSEIPFRYFKIPIQGFIGDVYTEPAFRHQGLAIELSRQALEWLRSRKLRTVRLLASSSGRPIYEQLGFLLSDEMVLDFDAME